MEYRYDIAQNSPEWAKARLGKFTASTAAKLLMAPSTQGYTDLIHTVTFERIAGQVPEGYSNEWMVRGKELEPLALQAYEIETFQKVVPVGIVIKSDWIACSPDGLIGEEGLIEVKCPKFSTHLDYFFSRKPPKDYFAQMQFQMMVTGRLWCDFFSFHPSLPPCRITVQRDNEFISEISAKLLEAIELVKQRIQKLQEAKNGR